MLFNVLQKLDQKKAALSDFAARTAPVIDNLRRIELANAAPNSSLIPNYLSRPYANKLVYGFLKYKLFIFKDYR